MIRLCVVASTAKTFASLYRGQFEYLLSRGFEITAVSSPGPEHEQLQAMGVRTVGIQLNRSLTPLADLKSFWAIWRLLRKERFDIVHFSTTKASMLTSVASALAGCRRRMYTCRGMLYLPEDSPQWKFFTIYQRAVFRLCTHCLFISFGLRDFMRQRRWCPPAKGAIIGSGSSNGVDLSRFTPTPQRQKQADRIRQDLGVRPDDLMILFLGRIRREKGCDELVDAFLPLAEKYPSLHLTFVGMFEDSDPIAGRSREQIEQHPRIHHLPWASDPAPMYLAGDVIAFPSYSEGFGNIGTEASAMERPVVSTDIIGCNESTLDGVTGLLVPPRDSEALGDALERLIDDPRLREQLGRQGRQRIEREFRSEQVWEGLVKQYERMMDT